MYPTMSDMQLDYAGFIKLVIAALQAAGIDYLIGGAVASWAWGEPRATQDLDVVIHVPFEAINNLSQELAKRDMLVPADIILEAIIQSQSDHPLSAIHVFSGLKADLYLLRPQDELRQSAFQRRRLVDLGPAIGQVYLHSPEDLIVYKLMYYSLSQQTKHLRDITAIVLTLCDTLDTGYINHWAELKGVNSLWRSLLQQIRGEQSNSDRA
jgi:hypothetical protein